MHTVVQNIRFSFSSKQVKVGSVHFTVEESAKLSSKMRVALHISISTASLQAFDILFSFKRWWIVAFHYGFNLHFCNTNDEFFPCQCSNFCSFKKLDGLFFITLLEFFLCSRFNSFVRLDLQIFFFHSRVSSFS